MKKIALAAGVTVTLDGSRFVSSTASDEQTVSSLIQTAVSYEAMARQLRKAAGDIARKAK